MTEPRRPSGRPGPGRRVPGSAGSGAPRRAAGTPGNAAGAPRRSAPGTRSGATRRVSASGGSGSSGTPQAIKLLLLSTPIIALVVGGWLVYEKKSRKETVVVDEKSDMEKLVAGVDELYQRGSAVLRDIRSEVPGAKKRGEALNDELQDWVEKFEELVKDHRNPETDQLVPEYAYLNGPRKRISQLLQDYNKISGMR